MAGVYDVQNRLVAKSITFFGDDLRAAEAIQAGLTPTQQAVDVNQQNIEANKVQIAANHERIVANEKLIAENDQEIKDVSERFSNLTEFDTKGETTVFFASGSKSISAESQSPLGIWRDAAGLTGYLVEVKGNADSTGNASMNQRLSMDRGQEVVAFLIQNCNVPVRRAS